MCSGCWGRSARTGSGVATAAGIPFLVSLGGVYLRKNGVSRFEKAFQRSVLEKKRPWVVPMLNFVERKKVQACEGKLSTVRAVDVAKGEQCAIGAGEASEDRVHVVVSEDQGWLFVRIYDCFNDPDASEFLMEHLYLAVHNELQGLFWEAEEEKDKNDNSSVSVAEVATEVKTLREMQVKIRALTLQP
ncbi:hypothetical protein HN51_030875 [Arachis hypogaea]